jgi:transposase
MSRRRQLLKLAKRGVGALITLVLGLEAKVRALQREVQRLKDRLALTSRNSGKPPSTDGLAKPAPKSLRQQTGRKPGGQPGHPGRTLQPVAQPDRTVVHQLGRCPCGKCSGRSLRQEPVLDYAKRQVFELPQKPLEVIEHQAEIKRCPVSGCRVTAAFPEQVNAPAQYGPRFRALMIYFNNRQFIPHSRLTELCEDLYGQPLSEASVVSANGRTFIPGGKTQEPKQSGQLAGSSARLRLLRAGLLV